MRLRDISPVTRLLFGSAVYAVVVVVALGMLAGWSELVDIAIWVLVPIAFIAGPGFIYGVVWAINRRDRRRGAGSASER